MTRSVPCMRQGNACCRQRAVQRPRQKSKQSLSCPRMRLKYNVRDQTRTPDACIFRCTKQIRPAAHLTHLMRCASPNHTATIKAKSAPGKKKDASTRFTLSRGIYDIQPTSFGVIKQEGTARTPDNQSWWRGQRFNEPTIITPLHRLQTSLSPTTTSGRALR